MPSPREYAAVLLCCMVACRADRITNVPPSVTSAAHAWSGGTLVLHSTSFTGADSVPTVVVGAETLAVRSLGFDSVVVQLPDTNGLIALSVRLRAGGEAVDSVRVHGFVLETSAPGPAVTGWLYPWPERGAPTALGFQGGRLVLLDFRLNTATPLTADTGLGHGCLSGPVPSATEPGLVVISSLVGTGLVGAGASCGPMIAVPVISGAAAPDTGPPPDGQWPAVQLHRGVWLISYKHYFNIVSGSPAGGFTLLASLIGCDQPQGFELSPRGDRVVPGRCGAAGPYSAGGIPVFDPRGPSVAYVLTAFHQTWGGDFSEGGDTLFQAAVDSLGQNGLFAVDPISGRILGRASFEALGLDTRVDPNGSWVYVAGLVGDIGPPFIAVFDRMSLSRVATLRIPAAVAYPSWGDLEIVTSASERRLYLTINDRAAAVHVLQFDLLP